MDIEPEDAAIILKKDGSIEMALPESFHSFDGHVPERVVQFIMMGVHFGDESPDLMEVLNSYLDAVKESASETRNT